MRATGHHSGTNSHATPAARPRPPGLQRNCVPTRRIFRLDAIAPWVPAQPSRGPILPHYVLFCGCTLNGLTAITDSTLLKQIGTLGSKVPDEGGDEKSFPRSDKFRHLERERYPVPFLC
jgi:hypothetical protein